MKKIYILILALFLPSCASVTNIKDSSIIESNKGVMLTNFITSHYGFHVTIIKKTNLTVASAIFEIEDSDNLRVITLPAGEYTWRGIYLGSYLSEFRNEFDFEIKENQVNYVGDVVIDINWSELDYNLQFRNNPKTISEFKAKYPLLANSLPINESITSRD